MGNSTLPSDEYKATSQPSNELWKKWLGKQLLALAVALDVELADERIQIYAFDLRDLSREQLEVAFTRARRECKWFPKISELREFACVGQKNMQNVEAEAAWEWAVQFLRTWGIERMSEYKRGEIISSPPPIPARTDYALRRIGHLEGLNSLTDENWPFKFRDFCAAYAEYPVAQSMGLLGTGASKNVTEAKQLVGSVIEILPGGDEPCAVHNGGRIVRDVDGKRMCTVAKYRCVMLSVKRAS